MKKVKVTQIYIDSSWLAQELPKNMAKQKPWTWGLE